MESRFIEIDGLRAHYLMAGEGEPVLLLPGFGASAAMSSEVVIKPLARRFRVYGLDLPGCGESDKPPIQYTFELGVRYLAGFLDALSLKAVNVIGLSQGGLVSLGLALDYSERVSKLVLVSSVGIGRDVNPVFRLLSLPIIGELFAAPRLHIIQGMLRQTYKNSNVNVDYMAREFHRLLHLPGAKGAILSALRSGMDLRGLKRHLVLQERLPSIKAPTLILWGAHDRVIPLAHAYTAHRLIQGSRLHVFPNCGHDPTHESSEEFIRLVEEFLDPSAGSPPKADAVGARLLAESVARGAAGRPPETGQASSTSPGQAGKDAAADGV